MKQTRIHSAGQTSLAAFTLVELLAVIGIIGILAGIIIPVVGRAKDSAKTAACASNLRQLAAGCLLYSAEHKNLLIPIAAGATADGTGAKTWRLLVQPYINQENVIGILGCPADEKLSIFDSARGILPASYGINKATGLHQYLTTTAQSRNVAEVVHPSRTIMISDISFVDNPGASPDKWTDNSRLPSSGNFGYARYPNDGSYSSDSWIAFPRHDNKFNGAFYDGHVESITVSRILDYPAGQPGCIYDNN